MEARAAAVVRAGEREAAEVVQFRRDAIRAVALGAEPERDDREGEGDQLEQAEAPTATSAPLPDAMSPATLERQWPSGRPRRGWSSDDFYRSS